MTVQKVYSFFFVLIYRNTFSPKYITIRKHFISMARHFNFDSLGVHFLMGLLFAPVLNMK